MAFEPGLYAGMLVGAVIVHDQMQLQLWRGLSIDFLKETDKLLMPMPCHAIPNDLAIEHAQSGKERRGFIAFVIMRHGGTTLFLQGQYRLGAIQRLDLGEQP